MLVGIKYCGGCNPRYERKKVQQRLMEELDESFSISMARENILYDFVVVIGGCTNCCAYHENLKAAYFKFLIKDESEITGLIDRIKEHSGK